MKKVILALAVCGAAVVMLSSCNKNCTCEYTLNGITVEAKDINIEGDNNVKSCKDLQKQLNAAVPAGEYKCR